MKGRMQGKYNKQGRLTKEPDPSSITLEFSDTFDGVYSTKAKLTDRYVRFRDHKGELLGVPIAFYFTSTD